MSVFHFLYVCGVYSALALGRKLENVKVGVHDTRNDRDVLSVDVKLMKNVIKCCSKIRLRNLLFPENISRFPFKQTFKRNKEARSCNHCCSGKVVSITYCE